MGGIEIRQTSGPVCMKLFSRYRDTVNVETGGRWEVTLLLVWDFMEVLVMIVKWDLASVSWVGVSQLGDASRPKRNKL